MTPQVNAVDGKLETTGLSWTFFELFSSCVLTAVGTVRAASRVLHGFRGSTQSVLPTDKNIKFLFPLGLTRTEVSSPETVPVEVG